MTQREKRKIKFWLFIFLVIFILFWFTEKKSIKEKITTGDGSVIPLDLEKLKAPAPILPKVDKPKFDSVFAKGGSAVINEKAFNQKVENMMQAQKQKGKIPVKSDVVKKLQEQEEETACTHCGDLKPLDLPPKRVGEFGPGDLDLTPVRQDEDLRKVFRDEEPQKTPIIDKEWQDNVRKLGVGFDYEKLNLRDMAG
ncbi:hypothetical protein, partial [Ornithobacterium rhinotracheale]